MRWNPSEDLSNWHRDTTIYSVGSSDALKFLWAAGCLGSKHNAKENEYIVDSLFPVLILRTFRSTRGNVLSTSGERKKEEKMDYQETSYGKLQRGLISIEV